MLLIMLVFTSTSCKKDFDINDNRNYPKVDHYISGFYIKAIDYEGEYSLKYPDPNLKAYFDYSKSILNTDAGNTGYYVRTSGQKRTITTENDVIKISLFATFTFSSIYPEKELEIYLIYQNKDGSYKVDTSQVKIAKINDEKCSLYTTFTFEKQKYQYSIIIGLNKEA